ncbi:MAG: HI1506-related protein [Treponema sp.]|nr:HI1506-related protein [Treponema sp.]
MDKEKINLLIERLCKAEKKERNAIVIEMAKENGLKEKEVWKLLIDAGYNPKEIQSTDQQNNPPVTSQNGQQKGQNNDQQDNTKKQSVLLRHKTEYSQYRRAGLVLTQKAQTYNVTEEQLAALEKDPWVVICKNEKEGASE